MRAAARARTGSVALRLGLVLVLAVGLVGSFGAVARDAAAVFGDGFGVAEINGGPSGEFAPALSDVEHAFWAGVCDRAGAAPAGALIAAPGADITDSGFGSRPTEVMVPAEIDEHAHVSVPAPAVAPHCLDWGVEADYPCSTGVFPCVGSELWDVMPGWRFAPVRQAGAHPDATAMFHLARNQEDDWSGFVDGAVDNVVAELPAGLVGDPTAVAKCTAEQFAVLPLECPPESQVGVLQIRFEAPPAVAGNLFTTDTGMHPVYNLEPRHGKLAEFGVAYLTNEGVGVARLVAKVRTGSDFGVTTLVGQIPSALPVISQQITIWGVPWAASNDLWRPGPATARMPHQGLAAGDRVSYDPSWGPIRPFLSNPTECDPQRPTTNLLLDSFEDPAAFDGDGLPVDHPNWQRAFAQAASVTGCEKPPFDPALGLDATSSLADGPSGLGATVSLPANDDPPAAVADDPDDDTGAPAHWRSAGGLASAQLRSAEVSLPAGWSVNPAGAAGLAGCSDGEFGLLADGPPPRFDNDDPFDGKGHDCPLGSRIGTVEIDTPVLEEPLGGDLVLADPRSTDPESGQMFRLFIVARAPERGLVAKVSGHATADSRTGRLTTTFAQNPRVPFEAIRLHVKGGQRAMLATPRDCGAPSWSATFGPWTAAHATGVTPDQLSGAIATDSRCAPRFAPSLIAGTAPATAGAHTALTVRIARPDGDEYLTGATVELPAGLAAAVGRVALCSDAQAQANACPADSRIGTVDAGAGAGVPFFLERKGAAYLTDGYKGAPYGMAVSVPVQAGPFTGPFALDDIVVRQAIHVDPTTAEVTVVSDPLPTIHHGIPLRTRAIKVSIDRPAFAINPTDCTPTHIHATLTSDRNSSAHTTTPYHANGCATLAFKPRLALRLLGRRQTTTGRHPALKALVRQPQNQAAIARAEVRLPKSLALDPANARGLCEYQDGTQPDPENHCPRRSIVGHARATSPLLAKPLKGPVFFVKNIRTDPNTGNQIRTLPMIIAALRGEIAINLKGTSSVKRQKLVSTFQTIPDAPVTRFAMRIKGGKNGILAITRTRRHNINICKHRQTATTHLKAHNNKHHNTKTTIKTPCKPKQRKQRRHRNRR